MSKGYIDDVGIVSDRDGGRCYMHVVYGTKVINLCVSQEMYIKPGK